MYGLIFENFSGYLKVGFKHMLDLTFAVQVKYGEDAWDNIRRLAGLDSPDFAVHQVYPEQLLGRWGYHKN